VISPDPQSSLEFQKLSISKQAGRLRLACWAQGCSGGYALYANLQVFLQAYTPLNSQWRRWSLYSCRSWWTVGSLCWKQRMRSLPLQPIACLSPVLCRNFLHSPRCSTPTTVIYTTPRISVSDSFLAQQLKQVVQVTHQLNWTKTMGQIQCTDGTAVNRLTLY